MYCFASVANKYLSVESVLCTSTDKYLSMLDTKQTSQGGPLVRLFTARKSHSTVCVVNFIQVNFMISLA